MLWSEYTQRANDDHIEKHSISNQVININYEDFIENPEKNYLNYKVLSVRY